MDQYRYIQVVRTCNQNCIFCSNPSNGKVTSLVKIKALLDLYKKEGAIGVVWTGGEPTLHLQICKAIAHAKSLGLENKMITNGQKIHDQLFLNQLVEAGLGCVIISAYSHLNKTQSSLTRKIDSLKNIIKSFEATKKTELNVQLNLALNAYNIKNIDKTIYFFLKKFPHISHITINNLDPTEILKENLHTIPKLSDIKKYLPLALKLIVDSKKTVRVERVPLCCMSGFEQFSTETRAIVKGEHKTVFFLDERALYKQDGHSRYIKAGICDHCSLNDICAGLEHGRKFYALNDLTASKKNSDVIIKRILK